MLRTRFITASATCALLLLFAFSARGQAPVKQSAQPVAPDAGHVRGNRYFSDYFKFTFDFPEGWVVHENVGKELTKAGEKILKDPRNLEAAKKGETESYNLLTVTSKKQPPTVISIITEDVNLNPKVLSPRDYITRIQRMMAREGTPVIEPITDLSRKGQQFAGMTVKMQIQAAGIYQRIESTLCRDYVLSFAVASPSQDELNKTFATFDSLEFSGCK